ncbi:MAG: hypothetical protein ACP5RQ_03125 [Candidatus Micrarchaeia archaeon]
MEMNEKIQKIIKDGKIKIRVKRSGMYQQQTFSIKYINIGNEKYVELFLDKALDAKEIQRVADEIGLPVESSDNKAFPKGKGAVDFLVT